MTLASSFRPFGITLSEKNILQIRFNFGMYLACYCFDMLISLCDSNLIGFV